MDIIDIDLTQVEARARRATEHIGTSSYAYPVCDQDVPALVAELRRLRKLIAEGIPACPTCGEDPGIVGEPCLNQRDVRDPWHDVVERTLAGRSPR